MISETKMEKKTIVLKNFYRKELVLIYYYGYVTRMATFKQNVTSYLRSERN